MRNISRRRLGNQVGNFVKDRQKVQTCAVVTTWRIDCSVISNLRGHSSRCFFRHQGNADDGNTHRRNPTTPKTAMTRRRTSPRLGGAIPRRYIAKNPRSLKEGNTRFFHRPRLFLDILIQATCFAWAHNGAVRLRRPYGWDGNEKQLAG